MDLAAIQNALSSESIDGWLFYDFRRSNPIAYQALGLPLDAFYSRRWFYFIPARGEPVALMSAVEPHVLAALPGRHLIFRTWQEMHEHLRSMMQAGTRIAMEYSPMNAIPYISRVDAGTLELVRSFGVEVVTSANLAQRFGAQLSEEQMESHREAGRRLIAAKDALFALLGDDLRAGASIDEYAVTQRFISLIKEAGLVLSSGDPHVAVNANASNPHYEPSSGKSSPIRRGDLVLFDFWAKLPGPDSVIADYTWMAFAGTRDEIPVHQREVFEIVRQARDTSIAFARQRLSAEAVYRTRASEGGRSGEGGRDQADAINRVPTTGVMDRVKGFEVDDATRAVIAGAGYGDYFVHRTGHSIGRVVHADGANMDNFESRDERILLASTCCSIEPGIYLPEFGIRSEVNILIHEHDVEVTGVPAQEEIFALL